MENKFFAIIVAAGTGRRMNSSVKKQYMEIAGHPVLYHTLQAFEKSDVDEVVVVTGEDEIPYVREQIVEKLDNKTLSKRTSDYIYLERVEEDGSFVPLDPEKRKKAKAEKKKYTQKQKRGDEE